MVKNLILSIIAIAILAGCSGKKDKTTDSDVVEAIPVKVQKLEKTDIARTLDYAANLEADKQVFYAPAATGRIEKIYVEVGDQIKKGQVLVEMDEEEIIAYIKYLEKKFPDETLKSLSIKIDGDEVDLDYTFYPLGFERIRRITGYLVGTLDRFNDAKAAEEKDRVKHA